MDQNTPPHFVAHNFKFIRTQFARMSQGDFAKQLKTSRAKIGSYEESRAMPKVDLLFRISDLYNLTLDELLRTKLSQARLFEDIGRGSLKQSEKREVKVDISGSKLDVRSLIISTNKEEEEMIDLIPFKAAAGYLNGYADEEYIQELPKFQLPFLPQDKTYRAFEIKGDSMPPLNSGSIVIGEYVKDWYSIQTGKTYIVASKSEGIVYKRLINNIRTNESIILRSDNPTYEDFNIHVNELKEVWKARAFVINSDYDGMCTFHLKFQ